MEGPTKKPATKTSLPEFPIDVWQKVMEYADFPTLKTLSRTCWKLLRRVQKTQTHRYRWKIWTPTQCPIAMANATSLKTNSIDVLKAFYKKNPNQIVDLTWCPLPDRLDLSLVPALTHLWYDAPPASHPLDFLKSPNIVHLTIISGPKWCDLRPLHHLKNIFVTYSSQMLIHIRSDQYDLFGPHADFYNLMIEPRAAQ